MLRPEIRLYSGRRTSDFEIDIWRGEFFTT